MDSGNEKTESEQKNVNNGFGTYSENPFLQDFFNYFYYL